QCQNGLNIYDSPQLKDLATQAAANRQLRILPLPLDSQGQLQYPAIPVCIYEDDYPGWLALDDIEQLQPVDAPKPVPTWTAKDIRDRIPKIIAYMKNAMAQPNEYLWGGVIGPNYDCSGLMQAAFRSEGIWLPRDAYQQEAFLQAVPLEALEIGDFIFFGPKERANHVALYLGGSRYIHSSGKTMGRNGIGIDRLPKDGKILADSISQAYAQIIHGAGRAIASYHPTGTPIKPLDANVSPMS
ncbi:MAG: C40 family peptidase, partial [Okeania sp. SIO2H7]|nr:C40 family peptidase [Okeania sp. SIO2H7]